MNFAFGCIKVVLSSGLPTDGNYIRVRLAYQNSDVSMIAIEESLVSRRTRERRGSAVVSTSACHAGGRGSLPGPGTLLDLTRFLTRKWPENNQAIKM